MNQRLRVVGILIGFIFAILILFSIFFKIDTYYLSNFINIDNKQIIQVKKDDDKFYENKKIKLKIDNYILNTTIKSVYSDSNYYYLSISKYLSNDKDINKVWIYKESVPIINYVFKELF